MAEIITEYPQFFTATNLSWNKLLEPDKYKDTIIKSMQFLVNNNRVIIYGFVIMPNHIHLIWQMRAGIKRNNVQRDFLKHTAQSIKDDMIKHHKKELADYLVNAKDRTYQFWERNALSIDIWTGEVLLQKLNYLHQNPYGLDCQIFLRSINILLRCFIKLVLIILRQAQDCFLTHYRG